MQLATLQFADTLVAAATGRIDHHSAADFEAALAPLLQRARDEHLHLVLDFAAVDYISSVGLRVLMIAARQQREAKMQLVVAGLQPVVAEIFTISRFDRVLVVKTGLEDALAACSAEARAAHRAQGSA
jgi:anti-sigma B factor antagonist/stage II sporulation protein AA (anti-sigma F factor antagonist)